MDWFSKQRIRIRHNLRPLKSCDDGDGGVSKYFADSEFGMPNIYTHTQFGPNLKLFIWCTRKNDPYNFSLLMNEK